MAIATELPDNDKQLVLMAGLNRFIDVLRLFDEVKSNWAVQEIAAALNVPTSTVYRTVRELVATGFLEPSTEAHYRLGPAFLEFDRMIRLTDPLVRTGGALLRDLVAEARAPCVAVLARLYGDRVVCAADERSSNADIVTSYERGRPMPLIRGATSKAILAQLPRRRLKRLIDNGVESNHAETVRRALQDDLAAIRQRGYAITRGEVDEGLVGIAAPISKPDMALSASLSLIMRASSLDERIERRLVLLVVSSASLLSDSLLRIAEAHHPPRLAGSGASRRAAT